LPEECDTAQTQYGNQTDEQTVFDQGSPILVLAQVVDQLQHVNYPLGRPAPVQIAFQRAGPRAALPDAAEPRSVLRRLGSASDAGQSDRNCAEGIADLLSEECDCSDTDHGNQAHEHTVFDQGSALLVMPETVDKLQHIKILYNLECPFGIYSGDREPDRARPCQAEPRSTKAFDRIPP